MSDQPAKMSLSELHAAFGAKMTRAQALSRYTKAVISINEIELHEKREVIVVLAPEEFAACANAGEIQVTVADIRSIPRGVVGLVLKHLRTLSFDYFDEDPENPEPAARLVCDFVGPNRATVKELVRPTATLLRLLPWSRANIERLVVDGSGLTRELDEVDVSNAAARKNLLATNDQQLLNPFRTVKRFELDEPAENLMPPLIHWIQAEELAVSFASVEAAQTIFAGSPKNEAVKHIKLIIDAAQSDEELTAIGYDFVNVVNYLRNTFDGLKSCEFAFDMGTLMAVDRNGKDRNASQFFAETTQTLEDALGGLSAEGCLTTVFLAVRIDRVREFNPSTDAADTIDGFKMVQPTDPQESDVVTTVYQYQREGNGKRLQATMTFVYYELPAAHTVPAVDCDWTIGNYAPPE